MQPARGGLLALLVLSMLSSAESIVLTRTSEGQEALSTNRANPIRKVVTMLQMMVKKVEEEGEKEKELYEAFMCYCKSGVGQLTGAVDDANKRIPELTSLIAELEALLAKLKADVELHKKDRAAAKAAIEAAVEIRKKEAAAAKTESVNNQVYIKALEKAIAALEKGMAGAFLQTSAATVLKRLLQSDSPIIGNLVDADRQDLAAFLDAPAYGNEYVPQSQEIVGMLKQMLDEMIAGEKDGTETEAKAIIAFKLTLKAKLAEIDALNKLIEAKLTRIGELSVKLAASKNDLEDTQEGLADNSKMLADLEASCKTKTAEWEERCKMRAMELAALADTIKILNDDDALDLFKKTLPSASLLQVKVTSTALRQRALAKILALRSARPQLDLIALALNGKKIGFGEIIKMIDEMVVTLKKEQDDDDAKMEYCKNQLDTTDDKLKELGHTLEDQESQLAALQEGITTTTAEIDALEDGITALDKSVAEATEQRKKEHEEYAALMAANGAAKELILFAKNRMQKFYNPKLYKPPPKRELTEEERITLNNGGTLAPTEAPAGIAGTGIAVFAQVAERAAQPETETQTVEVSVSASSSGGAASVNTGSVSANVAAKSEVKTADPGKVDLGAAPETFGGGGDYKKSESSGGALALMDLLVKDLTKEMTEAEAEEKNSQADYEKMLKDSATKRAEDSKAVTDKTEALANMQGELESTKEAKASTEKDIKATNEYLASLHTECDFIMKFYGVRKDARASEIDALGNAKAVLSGSDYSLLQTTRSLRGGH